MLLHVYLVEVNMYLIPSVLISVSISGGSGFKNISNPGVGTGSVCIGTSSIKLNTTFSSDNVTMFGLSILGRSSSNSLTTPKLN